MTKNIRDLFLMFFVFFIICHLVPPAFASDKITVLVLDSGTDFTHDALKLKAKANLMEFKGSPGVDDDKNGYVDDIYGWNFVENNGELVNLRDTPPSDVYNQILKIFEFLGRYQAGGKEALSAAEFQWLTDNYKYSGIKPLVNFIGGWAHGTHCAGIIAEKNNAVSINAIRRIRENSSHELIEANFQDLNRWFAEDLSREGKLIEDLVLEKRSFTAWRLEQYFKHLGKKNSKRERKQSAYISYLKPRLVNCSFSDKNAFLKDMIKKNMSKWGFKTPEDNELQEIVNLYVKLALIPRYMTLFSGCNSALLVIAADNDGENLDTFFAAPMHVPLENKIVVAATDRNLRLAEFSNYGSKSVDVAAPGVNILSAFPNNKMGHMSGTSMAAPLVLRTASLVLQTNPKLSPLQVKQILMETVDKKDWLKGKVRSGGVINEARAIQAAKKSRELRSLEEAIKLANLEIADVIVRNEGELAVPDLSDPLLREIYMTAF